MQITLLHVKSEFGLCTGNCGQYNERCSRKATYLSSLDGLLSGLTTIFIQCPLGTSAFLHLIKSTYYIKRCLNKIYLGIPKLMNKFE